MKLEVNLTHNPYDIIIEKGALKTVGQWVKSLWEPQRLPLLQTTMWVAYTLKELSLAWSTKVLRLSFCDFLEGEASKNLKLLTRLMSF